MNKSCVFLMSLLVGACLVQRASAAESKPAPANLTAAQIVEKHVAARGGLQAWRGAQTLSVTGKLEAGAGDSLARSQKISRVGLGASVKSAGTVADTDAGAANRQVQLPFRLEMKRPRMSRLEIDFAGQTAVQVYDGHNGWKVRPFLNRNSVEPFTAEEAKAQTDRDLDGFLIDAAAKGTQVELVGTEPVEGRPAYKLKVTSKQGTVQHLWIDAQSFLDVKLEGVPRRMDGKLRNVWIYQRDFRSEQGLLVPHVYETVTEGSPQTHKMTVETVAVNRGLDDSRFAQPKVLVAATSPAGAGMKPAIPQK